MANMIIESLKMGNFNRAASALVIAAIAALPSAAGAEAPIPGFLNPRTGAFQPRLVLAAPAASLTDYTGTFEVTLTITLASSIPTSQAIVCDITLEGSDTLGEFIEQSVTVAATRSGDTATCIATAPYSWKLGSTAAYGSSYVITTSAASGVPARDLALYGVEGAKLPANGTKTKIAATGEI
jgi:hypothetical protein